MADQAKFCAACGTPVDGARFCPACGREVDPVRRSTNWPLVAVLAVLAVLVVALGVVAYRRFTGADAVPASEPPTEQGLRNAAAAQVEAFLRNDAAGSYKYLAAECKARYGVAEWGAQIVSGLALAEGFSGVDFSTLKVEGVVTRNVTADSGETQVHLVLPDGAEASKSEGSYSHWIIEDGRWRTTTCEPLGSTTTSTAGP